MANALSGMAGPPPAPNPTPMGQSISGGAPSTPQQQQGPGQGQGAMQPPGPPPSHQQTVAAMRHFDAVERELAALLADPACGKSNMKSKIIDGATKLVAAGIVSASDAVTQLASVPDRPFEQKQWIEANYVQAINAAVGVLAHHGAAFQGQDVDTTPDDPEHHAETMSGLLQQYKGGR